MSRAGLVIRNPCMLPVRRSGPNQMPCWSISGGGGECLEREEEISLMKMSSQGQQDGSWICFMNPLRSSAVPMKIGRAPSPLAWLVFSLWFLPGECNEGAHPARHPRHLFGCEAVFTAGVSCEEVQCCGVFLCGVPSSQRVMMSLCRGGAASTNRKGGWLQGLL